MRREPSTRAVLPAISSGSVSPRSRRSDGPPTAYRTSVDRASTPRPVSARNPVASGIDPFSRARATIAFASGCSLSASTAAAMARTSASARSTPDDVGDDVIALRERARLVEQHGVDGAHPLERETILDEDAVPGGDRGRQRDHERDRQAERVRAGDDEHGHGRLDRALHVAGERPGDERHGRGAGRDVEQQRREAIGEHLGPTPARLGVGDEALDAGERGVLPHRVDLDAYRRVGRHRPGDDTVANGLGDRARLTGDHRLVELGLALDDPSVGRDPRTGRGPTPDRRRPGRRSGRARSSHRPSTRSASSGRSAASAASAPCA